MSEPTDFRAPLYEVKASLFKGLAHPVRIRTLELLAQAPEVSVTDLLAETGLEASHLSQHLSVLRRCHLVTSERRGLQMFYALAYPQINGLLSVSRELLQGILRTAREQLGQSPGSLSVNPAGASLPR
ncbi:transcriptional regulator [Arthrobacter livingstonensis]|uniref:Transcriptional regulator n=1 Tax=Arthrobacter livingstonensis TaxID=670078 RepID=A0A2V5LSH8_9MICC|nr:metalloregulator ArsR/SmtB family transcription factor [Arthrobacter livingstonensis]PYI64616.1 transcriptional regulator [Arthrobacter livingstonensis]